MTGADLDLWTRLPYEDLGMPIPAIFVPQRLIPPDTRGMWGFVPFVMMGMKDIPFARNDQAFLAADIRGEAQIELLVATTSHDPRLLAVGKFASSLPREWKQAVYDARALFVLIGPDQARPSSNPLEAIRNSPLFNSAIAVATVVTP